MLMGPTAAMSAAVPFALGIYFCRSLVSQHAHGPIGGHIGFHNHCIKSSRNLL